MTDSTDRTPGPMRIACTECHSDMQVAHWLYEEHRDTVVVAAECLCGRVISEVDAYVVRSESAAGRPLVAFVLSQAPDTGVQAAERILMLRDRITHLERMVTAAKWAQERPRK